MKIPFTTLGANLCLYIFDDIELIIQPMLAIDSLGFASSPQSTDSTLSDPEGVEHIKPRATPWGVRRLESSPERA